MVSKVAVIALVAIVAVPIMLGYAMNLEQVTEKDYKATGDGVNVTPLLQNGTGYNYVHADIYGLNTTFQTSWNTPIYPLYQKASDVKTPLAIERYNYDGVDYPAGSFPGSPIPYNEYYYYYLQLNYSNSDPGSVTLTLYKDDNTVDAVINKMHTFLWDKSTNTVYYTYYSGMNVGYGTYTPADPDTYYALCSQVGTYTGLGYLERSHITRTPQYVDFASGFIFEGNPSFWRIATPNSDTKSILVTINLDSVTDPNYSFDLGRDWLDYIRLTKTTVGSDVSWKATRYYNSSSVESKDLYYDPSRSDNTYQFLIEVSENVYHPEALTPYYSITYNAELRYVGGWPSLIGEANYYQIYTFDTWSRSGVSPLYLDGLQVRTTGTATISPVMRVDDSLFVGYEYPVIENKTYNPASFKTNPSTTISNPTIYGSSIVFGGNTYTVEDGNITLGTHKISVNGLTLSSIPNAGGGYDNMIGNTLISTTAGPSSITFNGKWSASITTEAQEEYEYTKTEWIAGGFAWDGIDQNFLMVGLITCLGVFIALGVYGRRSGARVLPLMIVCGGAALLFFVML